MREDHYGVRPDERAGVLQAFVDARVPGLQGVGEPECQISERDDDVRADLSAGYRAGSGETNVDTATPAKASVKARGWVKVTTGVWGRVWLTTRVMTRVKARVKG